MALKVCAFLLCSFPTGGRSICNLPKATGPCRAAIQRWYFNRAKGICERFIYGGCRGNANNFRTRRECERRCAGRGKCIHSIYSEAHASTWYVEGLAFCPVRNRKYETDLPWPFPGIFASSEFSKCIFFCFASVLCPSVVIYIRNLTQTKKESNSTWTKRIFRTGCHWPKAEDWMIYATMRSASYLQIKSFPLNWTLNTLVKATFDITFATAN